MTPKRFSARPDKIESRLFKAEFQNGQGNVFPINISSRKEKRPTLIFLNA